MVYSAESPIFLESKDAVLGEWGPNARSNEFKGWTVQKVEHIVNRLDMNLETRTEYWITAFPKDQKSSIGWSQFN